MKQVCPVDFDNPILSAIPATDLSLIQNTFLKANPGFGVRTPLVFILDEIHRVRGWEEYVIDLSRNPHWKVIAPTRSGPCRRG